MNASYWGPPFPESRQERDYAYLCELYSEPVDPDYDDWLAWWDEQVATGQVDVPDYHESVVIA